ncbi:MAG: hypothetical protein L3K19_03180 [Thermoplasmata archaeon]|nr:hypothetical protein [Thermoplasmata archaeon]
MAVPPYRAHRGPNSKGTPSPPTGSPPPVAVERERIEGLREDFDEAGLHVAERREFTGFRIGPVLDIPSGFASPGTIGWRRRIDWSPKPVGGAPVGEPDAWLHLLILPRLSHADASASVASVTQGGTEFRMECGTSPPATLLAHARSEVGAQLLERFTRATCAELESGD